MLFFNSLFLSNVLDGFKIKYPVRLENGFFAFLVVIYVCPNFKVLKKCMSFDTKICGSINNHVHHVNKNPHQEIEYGYIFLNVVVKLDRIFYAALLIRDMVMIDPNIQP